MKWLKFYNLCKIFWYKQLIVFIITSLTVTKFVFMKLFFINFSHAVIKIAGQNLALLIRHSLTISTTIVHPSPCSSPFFLHICGGGMLIEPYFHSCHNINRFIQAPFYFIIHMRVVIVNSYDIYYYIIRMILHAHAYIITFSRKTRNYIILQNCSTNRHTRIIPCIFLKIEITFFTNIKTWLHASSTIVKR